LEKQVPLLEIWNATRDSVLKMNLEAIVRIAGDGQLKDGSETSIEFRQFLTEVESEKLAEYATYCIENSFTSSGQVLQDVINEIGRRLGFKAENGRYQGVKNDIGYDGIWSSNGGYLVVEVKTTDAYTIKLDVIARYRDRLVEEQRVPKETPILLVIGRNDTESLEAQVRGSKHAWSMRIIGIDALIKLMEVNLSTLSNEVTEKIHTILRPFEYTRIDKIVDVVFTTAEDKENEIEELEEVNVEESTGEVSSQVRAPKEILMQKKVDCIRRVSEKYQRPIQKKKHSMYADASDDIRVIASISKRYEKSETFYWYAYHDEPQRKFLAGAKTGLMIFGLTDQDVAFALPYELLESNWGNLYETTKKNGQVYKHIYIYLTNGKFYLRVREKGTEIDLTDYQL
jgi:hypothetical protein